MTSAAKRLWAFSSVALEFGGYFEGAGGVFITHRASQFGKGLDFGALGVGHAELLCG
ncbi:hypothetical protein [Rhodoferax sediminis]|uniref:hypothetical protein n=1 Tax=Rhodoferax sediminis TaxID=2509614 RepID=UPI00143D7343|nr:hypothetical protein [Rhodoferax sediminis]